jgi:LacI family transcriptional regulator
MMKTEQKALSNIPKVLLLVESSRGSGRSLLQGIARFTHHCGPWSCYWEPAGLEEAWPKLQAADLDGIIMRDVEQLEKVLAFGVPTVVIGHGRTEVPGLVNVVTESEKIAQVAAEHLMACGFKNFAYCGFRAEQDDPPWSQMRGKAFADRIRQAGWPCENFSAPRYSRHSFFGHQRRQMASWLKSLPKPLGLLAANDDRATQLTEACKLAGISIPSEVGVIGVDNDEVVCGLSDPPLSSVALSFDRAGYEAASALAALMGGHGKVPSRIIVHPTHVVVRRSTDVVAVEDGNLAKALRYIRDARPKDELSVAAVAAYAGVSRRVLENRFRSELGCSALDEIRRVRTDRVARMLVETQLSVGEIAEALGFVEVQHFARYFRSVKKMSPLAYRKRYARHAL